MKFYHTKLKRTLHMYMCIYRYFYLHFWQPKFQKLLYALCHVVNNEKNSGKTLEYHCWQLHEGTWSMWSSNRFVMQYEVPLRTSKGVGWGIRTTVCTICFETPLQETSAHQRPFSRSLEEHRGTKTRETSISQRNLRCLPPGRPFGPWGVTMSQWMVLSHMR